MRKNLLLILLMLSWVVPSWATHLRAGDITATRLPGTANSFEFVCTIYRDATGVVADPTITMNYGDGESDQVPKELVAAIFCSQTEKYQYRSRHTYAAPGQYTAYVHIQYRNCTVRNIGPTPCNVEMYLETQILIAPGVINSTPNFGTYSVDNAAIGQKWFHNPFAYDPDGDSLSYELIPSRGYLPNQGPAVPSGYEMPDVNNRNCSDSANTGPNRLTINPRTGLMVWDQPCQAGEYNVAIRIDEWRFGRRVGFVVRDLQIIVGDPRNKKPHLTLPQDTCVIVPNGRLIKSILASDPDTTDLLAITGEGGPFLLTPESARAALTPSNTQGPNGTPFFQQNPATSRFEWQPGCEQVRTQPYDAAFRVQDRKRGSDCVLGQSLTDIKTWSIRVIGPPPDTLIARPGLAKIRLEWRSYICSNIAYFNVYRRIDSSLFRPDTCTTGVPPEEGFTLIGNTESPTQLFFEDDNNGQGLNRNFRYCYRITAVFNGPNGGESKESIQACAQLELNVPLLTHVSVERTDQVNGEIFVDWTRPLDLDTLQYPGPYQYELKRSREGGAFETVKSTQNLKDTTFTDAGINTDQVEYTYRLVFYFTDPLGGIYRDSAEPASNIRLSAQATSKQATLSWSANVPWNNSAIRPGSDSGYYHRIFKRIDGQFILIDSVPGTNPTYIDTGRSGDPMVQSRTYEYYVVTQGKYSVLGPPFPLANKSYVLKVQLRDTVSPCPPIVNFNPLPCPTCEEVAANPNPQNKLTWSLSSKDSCAPDLLGFNIYFKPTLSAAFQKIAFTRDTFFLHSDNGSLAGCYKVVAVDSSGNESANADTTICNDNCLSISLPNIITNIKSGYTGQNGKTNNYWYPICITKSFVSEVDLKIYNRWGGLVYASTSLDIRWPSGGEGASSQPEPGVYYYTLKVKAKKLDDRNPFETFKGWIDVVVK